MLSRRYAFTQPRLGLLRWITYPGSAVPAHIGEVLLGELFASPRAVVAGILSGLILNVVALAMRGPSIFALFILLDMALIITRIVVLRTATRAAALSMATPTDAYLLTAASWCALQGAMAFAAMMTNMLALQLLAATSVMGLVGPICARNYAAPRYAMLLVAFSNLPFIMGAILSGNPWLLVLAAQAPFFLFGTFTIVRRFQAMAVATLIAERESHERARHDGLTSLLNRFGLRETLDALYPSGPHRFVLFYLDLDGFKLINDTFGHQAGDEVLHLVAGRLTAAIRDGDVLARLGGDEFVIVGRDMSPDEGNAYALRVINGVTDTPYVLEGFGPVSVGISVGFACAPEDGLAGDDLHRKADAALYEAKAAGKGVFRRFTDCVRMAECA